MDVEIAKLIVQGGIGGISFLYAWILRGELDKGRLILSKLIEINERQNMTMADMKNEIVKLNERIK